MIDPKWETLINTPAFPEYDSGHSVSSAAAATVLTSIFGDNFAFEDDTGSKDNLAPHNFKSFWEAANRPASPGSMAASTSALPSRTDSPRAAASAPMPSPSRLEMSDARS